MRFVAPGEREAAERAWRVVRAAYEQREPVRWPRRHARALVAGAVAAAVVAAALSPPGRSVVRSLRETVGIERAQPALFSLPAPGQLLVTSRSGAWLVRQDGSRRLLGRYRDAAFSPHGLFIAATRANQLVALDPKGEIRWTLPRPGPRFPAWTGTRADTRIAYISRGRLRVVAGDGTGDHAIGRAAAVAPAWRPGARRVVAYATGDRVVARDVDGAVLFRVQGRARRLEWSDDGKLLLVATGRRILVYGPRGGLVLARKRLDAAFAPLSDVFATIRARGSQSDLALGSRLLFRGTGVFDQLTWSPEGGWIVVSWPTANQWVFVRPEGPRKIVGVGRITQQFGRDPRIAGWCCRR